MPPVNKSGTAEVYLSSLIYEMKGFLFFLLLFECVQKVSRLSNKQAINNLTNYTIITNKLH